MEFIATLLWFICVLGAAFVANKVWSGFLGRAFWVAIAPGVVVHEFSHVVACWVARAEIVNVQFFGPDGGQVVHKKPKLPVIGQIIISLAPLVGCSLALVLVGALLDSRVANAIGHVPGTLSLRASGLRHFASGSWRTAVSLMQAVWHSGYKQWQTYAFLYAAVCFGIALRPSAKDFGNAAGGMILLAGLLAGADWIASVFERPRLVSEHVLGLLQSPLRYLVSILVLVLIITIPVWALRQIVHLLANRRSRPAK